MSVWHQGLSQKVQKPGCAQAALIIDGACQKVFRTCYFHRHFGALQCVSVFQYSNRALAAGVTNAMANRISTPPSDQLVAVDPMLALLDMGPTFMMMDYLPEGDNT